jgi:hypothetical protein
MVQCCDIVPVVKQAFRSRRKEQLNDGGPGSIFKLTAVLCSALEGQELRSDPFATTLKYTLASRVLAVGHCVDDVSLFNSVQALRLAKRCCQ